MSLARSGAAPFVTLLAVAAGCGATAKSSSSRVCADPECSDGGAADAAPMAGCTEIGCGNGASIALDSPTGTWAPGAYTVQVSGDGTAVNCTLNVPVAATNDVFGTCTPSPSLGAPASLSLEFATHCMTIDAGDPGVTGVQCTPILGQSSLQLGVSGTPANVTVVVERGGVQLASESVALHYKAFFPNGQACGGACQEASATFAVAGAGSGSMGPDDGGTDGTGG